MLRRYTIQSKRGRQRGILKLIAKLKVTQKKMTKGISMESGKKPRSFRKMQSNGNCKSNLDKHAKSSKQTSIPKENNNIFAPNIQWIVFIITLVIRIYYVSQKENWWILHPDEIYQSLEVAHSEIYGYGFRPYEYLPPYHRYSTNVTVAMQHEYKLGMYSLRSPLFPKMFVYVGYVFIYFGYTGNLYVVWKCFHVSVSSSLVVAVYSFTKVVYRSHDTAVVSCILCASSVFLNIHGTHTLINSFISPFVFFIMAHFLSYQRKLKTTDNAKDIKDGETEKYTLENDHYRTESNLIDTIPNQILDHNANVVETSNTNEDHIKHFRLKPILFGFTAGLLIYIRPDSSIIIAITSFTLDWLSVLKNRDFQYLFTGMVLALCIGLKNDYDCYGPLIISPLQWIKFNVVGLSSSRLFGLEPNLYYLKLLLIGDNLTLTLSVLASFHVFLYIFRKKMFIKKYISPSSEIMSTDIKITLNLCAINVFILFIYSLKGHKETRFVHDVMPMVLVIFSSTLLTLYQDISFYCKFYNRVILFFSLTLIMSSQLYKFTTLSKNNISKWTYKGMTNTNDVNICLDFIGYQNDVTGLFLDSSIHMTGAYTILNQDVPIIALSHNEFLKFGMDVRETIKSLTGKQRNISIFTFNRISDFISVKNTQYLLNVLISEPRYNYLIIKVDRRFIDVGYAELFRYGSMKVLRRTNNHHDEQFLRSLNNQTRSTNNPGIINAEADWLIYYGAYNLAAERLQYSLTIDETNVSTHQLMIHLHHLSGKNKLARQALRKCMKFYSKTTCLFPPNHEHKF